MPGTSIFNGLRHDVSYAGRMLRKRPVTTLVVVLSLALGIGANTAIFGLINAVLLKRLPVQHPEQLMQLARVSNQDVSESFPYPAYALFREHAADLGDVFGFALRAVTVRDHEQTEKVALQLASDNYFQTLGVKPAQGRVWEAAPTTVSA